MKESFLKYLEEHPKQRFWQALLNWTRENVDAGCDFIFLAPYDFEHGDRDYAISKLKDTFYYEDDRVRVRRDEDKD